MEMIKDLANNDPNIYNAINWHNNKHELYLEYTEEKHDVHKNAYKYSTILILTLTAPYCIVPRLTLLVFY